jgi:hypothetical protein
MEVILKTGPVYSRHANLHYSLDSGLCGQQCLCVHCARETIAAIAGNKAVTFQQFIM